jgi:hypothetical protein
MYSKYIVSVFHRFDVNLISSYNLKRYFFGVSYEIFNPYCSMSTMMSSNTELEVFTYLYYGSTTKIWPL